MSVPAAPFGSSGPAYAPYLTASGAVVGIQEGSAVHLDTGTVPAWDIYTSAPPSAAPNWAAYQTTYADETQVGSYAWVGVTIRALRTPANRMLLALTPINVARDGIAATVYGAVASPADLSVAGDRQKFRDYVRAMYDACTPDYLVTTIEFAEYLSAMYDLADAGAMNGLWSLLTELYGDFSTERAAGLLMGPSIWVGGWRALKDAGGVKATTLQAYMTLLGDVSNCIFLSDHAGAYTAWESWESPPALNRLTGLDSYGIPGLYDGTPVVVSECSAWGATYGGTTHQDQSAYFAAIEALGRRANLKAVYYWDPEDSSATTGVDPTAQAFALRSLLYPYPDYETPGHGLDHWKSLIGRPYRSPLGGVGS